ncbi:hypothetical protein [Kitasatospora sp. NPDC097643]|uniref:hypothetical protein n=1 Tax=Kitasatospora sp. NPDC097643 TaxID=3157230 RepID=UPI003332E1B2
MDILAALCDVRGCTPNDLIEITAAATEVRESAGIGTVAPPPPVRRTTIRRPQGL